MHFDLNDKNNILNCHIEATSAKKWLHNLISTRVKEKKRTYRKNIKILKKKQDKKIFINFLSEVKSNSDNVNEFDSDESASLNISCQEVLTKIIKLIPRSKALKNDSNLTNLFHKVKESS